MTRLEIAVEAMKVLLPVYSKPVFMYDPDIVAKAEVEKYRSVFTGTFNLSDNVSIKQVAPNYKNLAEQCFLIADTMIAENGKRTATTEERFCKSIRDLTTNISGDAI